MNSKRQSVEQPFIGLKEFRLNILQKSELYAFYTRHDDTSILSDDILLEKARQIRTTMNLGEAHIALSNGWLEKL